MKFLSVLAFLLVIIGALNWGLWGFFQFDFVAWLCNGNTSWLSRLIYAIIGLSGLWCLRLIPRCCRMCSSSGSCGTSCKCCDSGNCKCSGSGKCCKNCKCDK